jgi:hypothetical protein
MAKALSILVIAAVLTLSTMLYAVQWRPSRLTVAALLWSVSPYVLMAVVLRAVGSETRAARVAGIAGSLAVLGFAALLYLDATFVHRSSTSGLVFVVAPPYLAVGGVAVFAVAWVIGKFVAKRDATTK